jgi:hypothetical protein
MSVEIKDLTYRNIAKMLASAIPDHNGHGYQDEQFTSLVNEYLEEIKRLPQEAKVALKSAYIFSHKVPRQEREDVFQDIALAVLKARTGEERLAYAIGRCDWKDWWSKYMIRQHYSLDSVVEDNEGNPATLGELIVGEAEWEIKMDGKLDAERIMDKLPADIKPIVERRMIGYPLKDAERQRLSRWVHSAGYQLLLA